MTQEKTRSPGKKNYRRVNIVPPLLIESTNSTFPCTITNKINTIQDGRNEAHVDGRETQGRP